VTTLLVVLVSALAVVATAALVMQRNLRRRVKTLATESQALRRELESAGTSLLGSEERWRGVLENTSDGVILLGHSSTPLFANAAARELLGLDVSALPPRLPSREIASLVRRGSSGGIEVDELVSLRSPTRRTVRVRVTSLSEGEALLTIRDVSEEVRTQTLRRQFVAHASHELKSPVASIHALAEAISEAATHDPLRVNGFSERLTEETSRLGRLVVDLLDLSRLEEPTVISHTPVDIAAAAQAELDRATETAPDGVRIAGEIEEGVSVNGDPQQIAVLIRNLMENAVRYSSPTGNVILRLFDTATEIVLQVEDTGIGIPMKSQTRVFERFYRVDEGRARSEGGTGLGLAIVKHVAELHGGTVELRSELGEGSRFTVRLPLSEFGRLSRV
jgi:signal transduction histidine kinase